MLNHDNICPLFAFCSILERQLGSHTNAGPSISISAVSQLLFVSVYGEKPAITVVRRFVHLLDIGDIDYNEEIGQLTKFDLYLTFYSTERHQKSLTQYLEY